MRRFLLMPLLILIFFSTCCAAEAPPSCPYCGRSIGKMPAGPPFAVMVDNHPKARPQNGVNQACLVFEAQVEGGITRFLAVYGHGQEVSKIGPVRSMRPYFVRLAKSLGAVLVHCGGSPEAYAVASELGLPCFDDIRGGGRAFWRDRARHAPHNLYTNTVNLWAESRRRKLDHPLAPSGSTPIGPGLGGASAMGVNLPYADRVSFTYEPRSGLYLRANRGSPHMDTDGRSFGAVVVVTIAVPVAVLDKAGRLRLDFGDADPSAVYQAGTFAAGIWQGAAGRVAQVLDAAGAPLSLAVGTRWFALVPSTARIQPVAAPAVDPVGRLIRIE